MQQSPLMQTLLSNFSDPLKFNLHAQVERISRRRPFRDFVVFRVVPLYRRVSGLYWSPYNDLRVKALVENWIMALNWCFRYHPSRTRNPSSKCIIISAGPSFSAFTQICGFHVSLSSQVEWLPWWILLFFFKAEAVFKEESRLFLKLSDLPEIITLANQVQSLRGNGAICVSLKENIHRIA